MLGRVARKEEVGELLMATSGWRAETDLGVVQRPGQRPIARKRLTGRRQSTGNESHVERDVPAGALARGREIGDGLRLPRESGGREKVRGVGEERPVVAIELSQALDLGEQRRNLHARGAVGRGIADDTPLDPVEEEEDVADVGAFRAP